MALNEKSKVKLVAITLIFAFTGLMAVLICLVNKATEASRYVFMSTAKSALTDTKNFIKTDTVLYQQVNRIVQTGSTFKREQLDSVLHKLIDSALYNHDLSIKYQYGLYEHIENDQQYLHYSFGSFKQVVKLGDCINTYNPDSKFVQASFVQHYGTEFYDYHLVIYFPEQSKYLISKLTGLLVAAGLLSLILIFAFIFFMRIINRQKKLAEVKNDFINNLTHEFKTPLFSIGLASAFFKKDANISQSPELMKYLGIMDRENNRLKNNVDKILQVALVDSDNFSIEKREVNMHELILEVISRYGLVVQENNASLHTNFQAKYYNIKGDETHLKNAVHNIIDNALKYCMRQPVVNVNTKNIYDKSSHFFSVAISDNGIGMSEEVKRNIFEKFYRAETGNIHTVKGFGLGLSYVKAIMDAHGALIDIQSEEGIGSTFTLVFKVDPE